MIKNKIFIAGHNGMVGSSIIRLLRKRKNYKVITINKDRLNLLNQKDVFNFLQKKTPNSVIIAAAVVGGIIANKKNKAKFLYENLQIQNNLIHGSLISGIKNLIFLGSSCIYPNKLKRPIKEKDILTGQLEETNDAYALAKISGIKLCEYYSKEFNVNFKSLMPTNLYGPNDNYNLETSHFIPALIKKVYLVKKNKKKYLKLWGNGKPLRETMHVDDLADACLFFLNKKIREPFINIGSGYEKTINEYAKLICEQFNVSPKILYDKEKPNGTFRKKLNLKIANKYGWKYKIKFNDGLRSTINDFINNHY